MFVRNPSIIYLEHNFSKGRVRISFFGIDSFQIAAIVKWPPGDTTVGRAPNSVGDCPLEFSNLAALRVLRVGQVLADYEEGWDPIDIQLLYQVEGTHLMIYAVVQPGPPSSRSSSTRNRPIGGSPMKPATKLVAGFAQMSSGLPLVR
jgi:hypothetical protein